MRRTSRALMLGIIATIVGATAVTAHPHVWVSSKSKVVLEQGSIAAIEQSWTFDEFYSAMAVQGLDTNGDGQYSREELAELTKINMDGLKEFAYFTSGRLAETAVSFAEPTEAYLDYAQGILSLHFRLPLKQPAGLKDFVFATYDPSFFIAFELAKDGVALAGAPATCTIELRESDKPAAAQPSNQTLAGAFADQFGAASVLTAKWASVACKGS